MTQEWGYIAIWADSRDLDETLREYGARGWELVTVVTEEAHNGRVAVSVVFKRAKE